MAMYGVILLAYVDVMDVRSRLGLVSTRGRDVTIDLVCVDVPRPIACTNSFCCLYEVNLSTNRYAIPVVHFTCTSFPFHMLSFQLNRIKCSLIGRFIVSTLT
ncbi:hypothetical protein Tcan_00774, partial [Toxocara canis]